ncbi:hypothetical protein CBER1_08737 [Cercospora berteroae]|uniref:Uncharacterized protein n=1 Tax=Cercospora berteroae TaxID=357750 RepID=A0A2S6BW41_9PEZI|nr:hypothetical protein CBER1_08737 [Cercospora berteroae]
MADAIEKLCSIAKALRLCRQCETRLTGIGSQQADEPPLLDLPIEDIEEPIKEAPKRGRSRTPRQRSTASSKLQPSSAREIIEQPSNEVIYKRCFINNVRSVDCDFQSFSVKDCDLENVTFRGCSFSNVVFEDLKLKNVTFFNVDFRNVWLKNINWICALWDGVGLANAVVTEYDFLRQLEDEKRPKLILSLKVRPTSKLSKTMILHPQRAQSSRAVQDGESEIVCQESVQNLLRLPDKVVDRILDYLFPRAHGEQIVMSDVPITALKDQNSQTSYVTRSPFGFRSAAFSYHGWPSPSASKTAGEQADHSSFHFCLPFLRVSKQCYELGIRHIYDRRLYFDDKPERCVAFLQDHQSPEHKCLAITLRYSSQTDPAAWRRLFDMLFDDKDAINELTVEISSEFWSSSIWRGKCWPETLIGWKGWNGVWQPLLSDPKDSERSFLEAVARLPGSRLQSGKVPKKAEDVRFFLAIKGADGFPSREAFVDEVQMKLRMRMLGVAER